MIYHFNNKEELINFLINIYENLENRNKYLGESMVSARTDCEFCINHLINEIKFIDNIHNNKFRNFDYNKKIFESVIKGTNENATIKNESDFKNDHSELIKKLFKDLTSESNFIHDERKPENIYEPILNDDKTKNKEYNKFEIMLFPCKISKYIDNNKRLYLIRLADGKNYSSICDYRYLRDNNRKKILMKSNVFIDDGYIECYFRERSELDMSKIYISLPNNEVKCVDEKDIVFLNCDIKNTEKEIIKNDNKNDEDIKDKSNEITKGPFYIWNNDVANDVSVPRTVEILGGSILVDYDEKNNLIGVEIVSKETFLEYLIHCLKRDFRF